MRIFLEFIFLWVFIAMIVGLLLYTRRRPPQRTTQVKDEQWQLVTSFEDGWGVLLARRKGSRDEELGRVRQFGNPYFNAEWDEAFRDALDTIEELNRSRLRARGEYI